MQPEQTKRPTLELVGILLLAAGAVAGTISLIVLMRAVKAGAFENAEDAKFVVFRDEADDDFDDPLP